MRTVSYVNFVEFEFQGNLMTKALAIGDVDNDNNNEIAMGNTDGELFIFKYIQDSKPWAKASDLGMISCLEIGDVTNQGINCLVSLSTEGCCNIFYLTPDVESCPSLLATWDVGLDATELATESLQVDSLPSLSTDEKPNQQQQQLLTSHSACQQLIFPQPPPRQQLPAYLRLQPAHTQKLSSNAKTCVIADIDGDGYNELIVSFTDRVVRAFKWVPDIPITSQTCSTASANVSSSAGNPPSSNFSRGKLHIHEKWKLAGQVSSMSVHKNPSGRVGVLVSQPGGSYVNLICSNDDQSITDSLNEPGIKSCGPSVCYHPLGSIRARNPYASTEVVSNIVGKLKGSGEGAEKKNFSAICTLDGTLSLVDGDDILWSIYVDHQLFALTKLDITGDNTEEVVACSWDGQTYIVNLSKEVVRFHFKDNVAAFCSGVFSLSKDQPKPCLCYATLDGKLFVFYNVELKSIGIEGIEEVIRGRRSDLKEELKKLKIDVNKEHRLSSLIEAVIYTYRPPAKKNTEEFSLKQSLSAAQSYDCPVSVTQTTDHPVSVTQTTEKPLSLARTTEQLSSTIHTTKQLNSPVTMTKELLPQESSLEQSLPPAQITEQPLLPAHIDELPLSSANATQLPEPSSEQSSQATEQPLLQEASLVQSSQATEQPLLQEASLEQSSQATEQPLLQEANLEQSSQATEQPLLQEASLEQSSQATEQPLLQEANLEQSSQATEQPLLQEANLEQSSQATEQPLLQEANLEQSSQATEQPLLQETTLEQSHSLDTVTEQPLQKLSFEQSLSLSLGFEEPSPQDSDLGKFLSPESKLKSFPQDSSPEKPLSESSPEKPLSESSTEKPLSESSTEKPLSDSTA